MKSNNRKCEALQARPEKVTKTGSASRLLKSIFLLLMLSVMAFMTSCTVAVRTPQYGPDGVTIISHDNGVRHNHMNRHDRREHRERKD